MEHLIELRRRLLISFLAVFVCGIIVFIFYDHVLAFLSGPYESVTKNTQGCGPRRLQADRHRTARSADGPVEDRRVTAGSRSRSRSSCGRSGASSCPASTNANGVTAVFFVLGSIVLFVLGAVVAWFTVEKALDFLLGIGGPGLRPLIAADKYLTLVMLMIAAFGFSFEFPLLLIFLLLVGASAPASSATSGGSPRSGSRPSRRSSLPARTPSPYCSWPFLCTSSMRPRS